MANSPWQGIPYVQEFLTTLGSFVRRNSVDVGQQPALNFLEGDNILLDIQEDVGNEEIEILIAVDDANAYQFEDLILRNTIANQPAASIEGRLFWATDEAQWYRDNGATWDVLAIDASGASRIAIDLRNPQTAANGGNVYPSVITMTDYEMWNWTFQNDVDGKLFGFVKIPSNVTVAVQEIVLTFAWNATSGNARFSVATKAIADGESFNPAALENITAQDIASPGTAYLRKDVTFTQGGETWVAGDTIAVEIFHEGAHANDTQAQPTRLLGAYIEVV